MDVQRIRTEGSRIDRPRNQRRVTVQLTTSVLGVLIEGHHVEGPEPVPSHEKPEPKTSRIEVYLDRLPKVAKRVRTPEQVAKWRQAEEMAALQIEEWTKSNEREMRGMSDEQKAEYVHRNCNVRAMSFAHLVGLRTGLPPIERMEIVAHDGEAVISYEDFKALDGAERDAYLTAPPKTDANEMERSATVFAEIMARVLAKQDAASAKAPTTKATSKTGK